MTLSHLSDAELDAHLRRTLHAIAAGVEAGASADEAPALVRRPRSRRRRRLAVAGVAVAGTGLVAAGALVRSGPEYVDRLPPDHVVVAGSVEGARYWMVESFHENGCGQPMPGVELVAEDSNLVGREWNTVGATYGELRADGCTVETSQALADPAVSFSGGSFVGDTFIVLYAVHPDVTAVRLTVEGRSREVAAHRVDGAGYALLEIPPGTASYTVELMSGDRVVPGSPEQRPVPVR